MTELDNATETLMTVSKGLHDSYEEGFKQGYIKAGLQSAILIDALRDSLCTCHPPSDHVCKRCKALLNFKEFEK